MFFLPLRAQTFTVIFQSFQKPWLSRCDLHAIEDLNRDKPVCLRTTELRGDHMGTPISSSQAGCSLDIGVGYQCPIYATFEAAERQKQQAWKKQEWWDVLPLNSNISLMSILKQQYSRSA